MADLSIFFKPKNVAVVGASDKEGKVGYEVIRNLKDGYPGTIYPINLKEKTIQGIKAFPNLSKVKDKIDLVVICVPSQFVLSVIEDMHKLKIGYAIIITAGFKEVGPEGALLENKLKEKLIEYDIRAVGPNCLGILTTELPMNATFATQRAAKGNIAFLSQSGAMLTGILDWAENENLGFSHFVSLGNKANVDETDLILEIAKDENTKVILAYLEAVERGSSFITSCQKIVASKPVVIIKSGISKAGAKAASSHTGSMTGSNTSYDVAFKKAGVLRAETIEELFDISVFFSSQSLPPTPTVAIVTNAGGPGIIATDSVELSGLELASFSAETLKLLHDNLPPAAAIHNPIDILGTGNADQYSMAVEACLKDDGVGSILVILTPQGMTQPQQTAERLIELHEKYPMKPISAVFMGGAVLSDPSKYLKHHGIPSFPFPERAINGISAMWRYSQLRDKIKKRIPPSKFKDVSKENVDSVIESVLNKGRVRLLGSEAIEIAKSYGIESPLTHTAFSLKEAKIYAEEVKYPLVMKVSSPDIIHKTDFGGVVLGVKNEEELTNNFRTLMRRARDHFPNAKVIGVDIQQQVDVGEELILGVTKDSQFGHLIMIGAGGIYTNILKDVSFGLVPVNHDEATEMLESTKIYQILKGARGQEGLNTDKANEAIERISQLLVDFPEILDIDINPFFVTKDGINAVDVKITISEGDRK